MPGADPRAELVLVLAPTGRDGRLIADELGRHGLTALVCPTLDQVCTEIEAGAGVAVLAEEALPPTGLAGLIAVLGRQPPWSDLPLLILTGKGTPSAGSVYRFAALEPSANVAQLERPVRTRTLLSSIRAALRARRRQYDVCAHLVELERQAAALRDREARLQLAVEIAHMGAFEIDLLTDAVEVNEPGRDIYGWADTRSTFARVRTHFHPADRERVVRQVEQAFDPNGPGTFELEHRIVRTDDAVRWIRVRGRAFFEGRGGERRAVRCAGTYLDVTERKETEEALRESEGRHRLLAELAAATQPLTDPDEIMAAAARLLAEHLGTDRCAYAEVEDESVYVITGDHCRGVPSVVGRWPVVAFGIEHLRMMRAGEPHVVEDSEADAHVSPADLPAYQATRIRAVICVPLLKDGRLIAAMAVHQAVPRRWTPAEVELVRAVVGRCWEALERARADRARRAGEAQLRLITDTVPALIAFVDADQRYAFVNRQYEVWFDRPRADIEGKHLWEVIGRNAYEHLRPHVERGLAGERFEFEAFAPYPTGDRYIQAAFVPQVDDSGVTGYFSLITDVTDRTRAQQALRASEERYRVLATATSDVVYRMSPDWAEIHPLDGRDLVASSAEPNRGWMEQNLPAHEHERVTAAIREAIAGKTTFELEHQVIRPDGSLGWTLSRAAPILDAAGAIVEWFGTARDVTERKWAEEALRASEERYRTLFTSMDEGFCVVEMLFDGGRAVDYRFLEVNPAFERHTGLADAVGRTVRELAPGLESHWFEAYGRVARAGQPERFVSEAASLDRWFDVYAFPLGGGDRVAVLFTDITARIRGEQERERLLEQLRDADRRKDEFLALLAHELRNPLAPLRNGLQVLRMATRDAAAVARAREMMDRQLAHMVRLIDDLLDVSRITRNKMELRRARVSLSDVVSSAVETVRPTVDAAGHELLVALPDEPIHLDADLTRLAQVVGNLLGNSAKYTLPGGQIWLTAEAHDGHVVVTVRDTGIGIPPASLPHIFDMFSQVDRSIERSTGGLGIGLALVKGLVNMHGGTVTAASDGPGKGSAFTVRLPLLREAPPSARDLETGGTPATAARRILVVDDNRDAAESMSMMLNLLGHEVAVAHDGVEAIEAAERVRPEVILMDVGMPRLNGLDATRRIRATAWGRGAVIVALTGWGQENDRALSKDAGCDGHLVKPVDLTELEKLLVRLTAGRHNGVGS